MECADSHKLNNLREQLLTHGLTHYWVPSSDAHLSEYVADCWQRRRYISDFDGSVGDVIVGLKQAWLWADSRYWIQATQQLSKNWTLMKLGAKDVAKPAEFLAQLPENFILGYDPQTMVKATYDEFVTAAANANGRLVAIENNLVDEIWSSQPAMRQNAAEYWPLRYAGESVSSKLSKLKDDIVKADCEYLVVSSLDALAWLFNIRGNDIDFNPLVISYALVKRNGTAILFTPTQKITPDLADELQSQGVSFLEYADFISQLSELNGRVWVDGAIANMAVVSAIKEPYFAATPIEKYRAIKNEVELSGMRQAHIRDGLAVCRYWHWLSENVKHKNVDEISGSDKLQQFREHDELLRGLSFDTISGFGANGAIVHYRSTPKTCVPLTTESLYLFDSGGQYLDGTTDITRTAHFGNPSVSQKQHFTRVLKGHLAVRNFVFAEGTTGAQIDPLARQFLWRVGLDYGHGTGHGVGCYLSVHQGTCGISSRVQVALKPGMVVSNEPGYYLAGHYGIRIENLCEVVVVAETDEKRFLSFADLTLVPYGKNLIDIGLLTPDERTQIDAYHEQVRAALMPLIDDDKLRSWLIAETSPL